MAVSDLVVLEADQARFVSVLDRLWQDANARLVFLLDKNGQQIASLGDLAGVDPTALASLTAGNVAATEGLAELIGEGEFSSLYHEGEHDSLHVNVVGGAVILGVVFDLRSSLGLVRLRVKKASLELAAVVEEIVLRARSRRAQTQGASPFADITDEDIDALFG